MAEKKKYRSEIGRYSKGSIAANRLQSQVERQRNKVTALGGAPAQEKPGMLARTFDILSRPVYAGAEATARFWEGQSLANVAKGAAGGFAGKHKTNYAGAIERGAQYNSILASLNKNKVAKGAVGFTGDILLDPTTYIGAGIVKKAGQEAIEKAGAKVLKESLQGVGSEQARREIGRRAVAEALEKSDTPLGAAQRKRIRQAAIQDWARESAIKAGNELASGAPGKVQLRLAGKEKLFGRQLPSSEKLYKGVADLGKLTGATEIGKGFKKAFRPAMQVNFNQLKRLHEGRGYAAWDREVRSIRQQFAGLTKEEKRRISHAIERGENLDELGTTGRNLGEYQKMAKEYLDNLAIEEGPDVLGVLPKEKVLNNYVYHYYKKGKKSDIEKFKDANRRFKNKAIGSEKFGPAQERKLATLEDAKNAGFDPVEEIDDILALRLGKHQTVKSRKEFVHALVTEYGTKMEGSAARQAKKMGLVDASTKSEFAPKGMYVPRNVAEALGAFERMHLDDQLATGFLRKMDKVQGYWKFGATAMNPGHHIRNMIGDVYLNYLDGVVNPATYDKAMRILAAQGRGPVAKGIRTARNTDVKVKVGNRMIEGERAWRLFEHWGGKTGFFRTEFGDATMLARPAEAIRGIAETRENFTRFAHFLDALQKEGKGAKNWDDINKAATKAAARVRKWNLDYGDLTEFEQKVMKRAIPFYTFMRKNLPLQIEALALKPGRIAAIPKGQRAIQTLLGTEEADAAPGIGGSDTVSHWLKEMAPIRLRGEGEGKNAIYWSPGLPIQDIGKFGTNPKEAAKELLSQVTPLARIPIEVGTGRQVFSGAPIQNWGEYALGQNPMARVSSRVATGKVNWDQLLNYLTGAGVYEMDEREILSELRRQQDPLQSQIRNLRKRARGE